MRTIKTWQERLGNSCGVTACGAVGESMQFEIDELRAAQNICGNGAGCLYKEATIDELRAENARLRYALILCLSSLQYAWGCIENITEEEDAKIEIGLDAARAALGEKS